MATTTVRTNLDLKGGLRLQESASFPDNAKAGATCFRGGVLYVRGDVGGLLAWFPTSAPFQRYVHTQGAAASVWEVNHGLTGDGVSVLAYDANGNVLPATMVTGGGKTSVDVGSARTGYAVAFGGVFASTSHEHDARYSPYFVATSTLISADAIGYTGEADGGLYPHLRGGSDEPDLTFQQAVARADFLGVRLPTIEEMEANIASGTGGGFDARICWTASPVPGRPGYVYAALGLDADTRHEYPTDGSQTANCRFVASVTTSSMSHALGRVASTLSEGVTAIKAIDTTFTPINFNVRVLEEDDL